MSVDALQEIVVAVELVALADSPEGTLGGVVSGAAGLALPAALPPRN